MLRALFARGAPAPCRRGQHMAGLHGRSAIARASASNSAKPDIKQLAKMAQIGITDKEVADFEPKINSILDWFGQLQAVDVAGAAPAIHASDRATMLRPDIPRTYEAREQLLAQPASTENAYVRVPKIATAADADTKAPKVEASAAGPAAGGAAAAASTSAPAAAGAGGDAAADLDSLKSLDFRVGRIIKCERHPEADTLYVEEIDCGEPEPRTIVSGLVKYVPIEQMQDRMVVICANLKPRNMRGIKSAGMVLAASDEPHLVVAPISPPAGAKPGERIYFGEANKEQPAPLAPNSVEKKKLWEKVAPGLRTGKDGTATWNGLPMMTSAGPVVAPSLPDARIA